MSITAAQTETSVYLKFMAFVLEDANELHVWDINSAKARCLARLKPNELVKGSSEDQERSVKALFTCIRFSASQVSTRHSSILILGTPKLRYQQLDSSNQTTIHVGAYSGYRPLFRTSCLVRLCTG